MYYTYYIIKKLIHYTIKMIALIIINFINLYVIIVLFKNIYYMRC